MPDNAITIELSKAQIDRVRRSANEDHASPGPASGWGDLEFRVYPEQLKDRRLSHSLVLGLMILASFPADGTTRSMKDVASELNIGGSTIHRYISTLAKAGLLERDPVSLKYGLAGRG